jgi:hypothetical protein
MRSCRNLPLQSGKHSDAVLCFKEQTLRTSKDRERYSIDHTRLCGAMASSTFPPEGASCWIGSLVPRIMPTFSVAYASKENHALPWFTELHSTPSFLTLSND